MPPIGLGEQLVLGLLGLVLVALWFALGDALFGASPGTSAEVGFLLIIVLAVFALVWNERATWRRMACIALQGLTMTQVRDCLLALGASVVLDDSPNLLAVELSASRRSWGETVYALASAPDRVFVLSRCTIPQFTSWGKNDDNLVVVANAALALGGRASKRDRNIAAARWRDISTRLDATT